jgi:type I restriction-modification system DNA methylase subunit
MNLFLHGVADFQIVRGDTLRSPAFFSGDSLATFDCVIANPPFSLEKWGDEVWSSDPYGRNFAGMPPAKSGDYAWVQHMIKSMAPKTGRMAVVLPHGALFRMGKEGEIRKKLLGMDLLEAVIGLGPNLFYGTGLAACILVFRQKKAKDQEQGADRRRLEGVQDRPRPERTAARARRAHPRLGIAIYDVEGIARVVTLDEIAANDHNLNIPRYVEPKVERSAQRGGSMKRLRRAQKRHLRRRRLLRGTSTRATTSSSFSRCCSTSGCAMCLTKKRRSRWRNPAATGISPLPGEPPLPDPARSALARPRARPPRTSAGRCRTHAGDRDGQPRQAVRHLRRRPMDQQGPPVRCHAARSDRALSARSR